MKGSMRSTAKVLLALCLMWQCVESRRLSEVQLAKELYNQGFPLSELNDWVCLVMGESSGSTSAMNPHNTDGSTDWGLFQINDRWWCRGNYAGGKNGCNVDCADLAKDDITKASKCAQLIKRQQGFKAWVAWNNNCKGKTLKDYTQYVCGRHS